LDIVPNTKTALASALPAGLLALFPHLPALALERLFLSFIDALLRARLVLARFGRWRART
jgi:hypothetical protein